MYVIDALVCYPSVVLYGVLQCELGRGGVDRRGEGGERNGNGARCKRT